MALMAYRAFLPDNLFRLSSCGGHNVADVERALAQILSYSLPSFGLILDLSNGFPSFPKEEITLFSRSAREMGVRQVHMAVVADKREIEDIRARYEHYPILASEYIQMTIGIFDNEDDATQWVSTILGQACAA